VEELENIEIFEEEFILILMKFQKLSAEWELRSYQPQKVSIPVKNVKRIISVVRYYSIFGRRNNVKISN